MARILVIGAGFSGLSAAAYLSAAGHEVHVIEKHETAGGRARQLKTANGYVFDMGPSWYWMPDIFENFFNDFGYSVADFYELKLLDPAFEIVFKNHEIMSVPADYTKLCALFESIENGSAVKLDKFMKEAEYKYKTGMENLVKMPGISITEFLNPDLLKGAIRLQIFSSFSNHVRKYFSHPKLIALMEFPVLFLGAMPSETPALYSLMNYAGLKLGTWYPQGGFGKVIDAMKTICLNQDVIFHFNSTVEKINVENHKATDLLVNGKKMHADAVIASADYHHVENDLLSKSHKNYTSVYWSKKTFAPSCLIFYVGVSKKISALQHHTLFFEEDLFQHAVDIYKKPQWPAKPLFYVCCPSKTDSSVAPGGHENLFLLMPVAPGLEDNENIRQQYFQVMIDRLEKHAGESIQPFIDYKKSYCVNDFVVDYNAYKGNAYGLANTLRQTAILKPAIRNKQIKNLFYAGQLTVPGPGVPPSLISGKIAAQQLLSYIKNTNHEAVI
jgi:phytoene desaturase